MGWRINKHRCLVWTTSVVAILFYVLYCRTSSQDRKKLKTILFWYERYRPAVVGPSSDSVLREIGCPFWQCRIINQRPSNIQEMDAIVFHQRSWIETDLPFPRSPHQFYVQLTMESPAWNSPLRETEKMAKFFNLTMTYRRDSDVINPYGWFEPLVSPKMDTAVALNYAANKTKLCAWFVSNCESTRSGRIELAEHLAHFIDLDVYGRCGHLRCPRSKHADCMRLVESKYKFYLSLENSFCLDYITEKFFDVLQYHIVPIVVDLHGHYERTAPPHSFINAARFNSVRQLADYLLLLDRDDTLYNEYFEWRKNYVVRDNQHGICQLCAALHRSSSTKIYHNFTEWWFTRSQCRKLVFSDEDITGDYYWKIQPLSPA